MERARLKAPCAPNLPRSCLKPDLLLLIDLPASVDAAKLVVLLDKVVARHQKADVGLLADVALQTKNADVRILIDEARNPRQRDGVLSFFFTEVAGRVVACQENSESILSAFA